MRKIVLAFFATLSLIGYAQVVNYNDGLHAEKKSNSQIKKENAQKEKRLQAQRDSIAFCMAKEAMQKMSFVIQTDRMSFRDGTTLHPDNNTNFISVEDGQGMVQLAFNNGYLGFNGLGGITVQGNVSNIKRKTDKKGNETLIFSVFGTSISAQITVTVYAASNEAIAIVMPNFSSQSLTVYGKLLPRALSNTFQGRSF